MEMISANLSVIPLKYKRVKVKLKKLIKISYWEFRETDPNSGPVKTPFSGSVFSLLSCLMTATISFSSFG